VRENIMQRLKAKVDWKKVLRYFIGRAQRSDRTNTIRKINKRFPYIHAGRKTNYSANIAIAIDQSGSVGDEMLNEFFNELNKLASLATFTVIPFDDRVFESKVYTWKKAEKRKWERVLSGGTNFDAPTTYVNKHSEFDGLIILTDMYANKPRSCNVQRAWLTTEDCKRHMPFQTNEIVMTV
jgi:predicted metal-dependent peptidase